MDTEKRFKGLWNASAEKRYKHFKTYVADWESVWMISKKEKIMTIDSSGYVNVLVWPSKEFAMAYDAEAMPIEIEVHDFCRKCEELLSKKEIRFMVFPTDKNTYVVETEKLLNDILEELDLVE